MRQRARLIPDSVGRLGEVTLNGFEQVAVGRVEKLGNQIMELDQLEYGQVEVEHSSLKCEAGVKDDPTRNF